jgi:limonene-1,2-epoxide hydrolase
VDLGPGIAVVVVRGRIQAGQLDGVDTGGASRVQPFGAGQQRRCIACCQESPAQRDRRKGVPGVWPRHHRDAHRPTLPQPVVRLMIMTEQTLDNTRTVEVFLHALQDADLDTAGAALAENLVYQNVGLPTIHGRRRAMKLFSSLGGGTGFEVKIHRIAADGAAVLTERTDALIFGPLRLQFWVCGVFEVHDGQITLWRDYFDFFDMFKATLRGLAGLVVPSLRASF